MLWKTGIGKLFPEEPYNYRCIEDENCRGFGLLTVLWTIDVEFTLYKISGKLRLQSFTTCASADKIGVRLISLTEHTGGGN